MEGRNLQASPDGSDRDGHVHYNRWPICLRTGGHFQSYRAADFIGTGREGLSRSYNNRATRKQWGAAQAGARDRCYAPVLDERSAYDFSNSAIMLLTYDFISR